MVSCLVLFSRVHYQPALLINFCFLGITWRVACLIWLIIYLRGSLPVIWYDLIIPEVQVFSRHLVSLLRSKLQCSLSNKYWKSILILDMDMIYGYWVHRLVLVSIQGICNIHANTTFQSKVSMCILSLTCTFHDTQSHKKTENTKTQTTRTLCFCDCSIKLDDFKYVHCNFSESNSSFDLILAARISCTRQDILF